MKQLNTYKPMHSMTSHIAHCLTKVSYASCSGPGSMRFLQIPAHGIGIDESQKITEIHPGPLVSFAIASIAPLTDEESADLEALTSARTEYELARTRYETAQATFWQTTTGVHMMKWLKPGSLIPLITDANALVDELVKCGVVVRVRINAVKQLIRVLIRTSATTPPCQKYKFATMMYSQTQRIKCEDGVEFEYIMRDLRSSTYVSYRDADMDILTGRVVPVVDAIDTYNRELTAAKERLLAEF
jgi:hypothetical protein